MKVRSRIRPVVRYEYDWDKLRKAFIEETQKQNISGQMLAEEIGLTQSLYSMFMTGKRKSLGRESMFKVCEYFGVPHEHWYRERPSDDVYESMRKFEEMLIDGSDTALDLIKEQINILYKKRKIKD